MPTGSAADQANLLHSPEILLRQLHFVEDDLPGISRDAPHGRLPNGLGLFVNFLQHEMLEPALFRHDGVPGDALHPGCHRAAPGIGDRERGRADSGQIAVAQINDVPRVSQDCRDVRGNKGLSIADADDHRRALAGGDQRGGVMQGEHHQSVEAGHFADGLADGFLQAALVVFFDQVGDDLGVGLRDESMSIGGQGFLEGQVVFDDPVVDHHEFSPAVAMGVGVLFRRPAVGCPAGVAYTDGSFTRVVPDGLFKVADLARSPADMQTVAPDDRDSSRIVPSVLQAFSARPAARGRPARFLRIQ